MRWLTSTRGRGPRWAWRGAAAVLVVAACGRDQPRARAQELEARLSRLERREAADSARMSAAALAYIADSLEAGGTARYPWRVTHMDRDSVGACVYAAVMAPPSDHVRDGLVAVRVTQRGEVRGFTPYGGPCR